MRTIRPDARLVQELDYVQQQLPIDKPVAQYIRQSTEFQVKHNKQSFVLQDEKLGSKLVRMGFIEVRKIEIDQGKSGQKLRFQRKGLDDLYKWAEHGEIGAIAFFDASRLWRDPTHVWYNDYIQMCIKYNLPTITMHRVYWPTNIQDMDALREDFKQAAFYLRHIYEKMIPAKYQAIEDDHSYGGGAVPFGFIVAETAERKFFVVYEPHAEIIRWLFKRFREVGGSLARLGREVHAMGISFPAFTGIEKIPHVALDFHNGGYPLRTREALHSILTNPVYIGWYVYNGVIISKQAHDPIVPLDGFMYAYTCLSPTTLDGQPNEHRPAVDRRMRKNVNALLDGILRNNDNAVYVMDKSYLASVNNNGWKTAVLAVPVALIDTTFSDAVKAVLVALEQRHKEGLQDSLHKQLTALQQEKTEEVISLTSALANIDKAVRGWELDKQSSRETGNKAGLDEANRQLARLYADKTAMQDKARFAHKEQAELAECRSLHQQAVQRWDSLKYEKQRRFIKLIVAHANITKASPHILRLDISLKPPLNTTMTGYLYRKYGNKQAWTEEEKRTLARLYMYTDRVDILQALPVRGWNNIVAMAGIMGLQRATSLNTSGIDDSMTYSDYTLLQELDMQKDTCMWVLGDTIGQAYKDTLTPDQQHFYPYASPDTLAQQYDNSTGLSPSPVASIMPKSIVMA
jgi:DNA invertase Pin-like site-specific DNA recombinase